MRARRRVLALASAVLVCSTAAGQDDHQSAGEDWRLVWADEFDGHALDPAKWTIQLGDGSTEGLPPGWGNNEHQTYRAANVALAAGNLVITARREDADGYRYTSGRITTAGKFHARYGRFEARLRTPPGQGLWPAFWMLPEHSAYGGWAASGEIDIVEVFSRNPAPFIQGAAHYGMAWPLNAYSTRRLEGIDPADGFHVYAVEWDETGLRWFADGAHYFTIPRSTYWSYFKDRASNAHRAGGDSAPFDQPFHLLLNLAVGGNLPGDPSTDALPGQLLVDYVRVYECSADPVSGIGCGGLAARLDESVLPTPPSDVFRREYVLYGDALGSLAPDGPQMALEFHDRGDLTLWEIEEDGRGLVLEIAAQTGSSLSIHAANSSPQRFFGMGNAELETPLAGELQFDLYIVSAGTNLAGALRVGLASGPAEVGFVELSILEQPLDKWTTITVQISDIVYNSGGAVDLARVHSLFTLAHTAPARVRLDNIKIICAHSQQDGCGITAL